MPHHRQQNRFYWLGALVALGLLLTLLAPIGLTQGPTPSPQEINEVAKELYCPLCNGVRLDNCDLLACIQMREVISDKLSDGLSKDQIKDDFVAQYGPVVLGEPPRQGLNLLAWLLPVAAIVLGGLWLFYIVRRWTRKPAETDADHGTQADPDDEQLASEVQATDDYMDRVESDLAGLE